MLLQGVILAAPKDRRHEQEEDRVPSITREIKDTTDAKNTTDAEGTGECGTVWWHGGGKPGPRYGGLAQGCS